MKLKSNTIKVVYDDSKPHISVKLLILLFISFILCIRNVTKIIIEFYHFNLLSLLQYRNNITVQLLFFFLINYFSDIVDGFRS